MRLATDILSWVHELASRILYELCGWPMAFLRPVQLDMSYMAGQWHS